MDKKILANEVCTLVGNNTNSLTAGERGALFLGNNWLIEKLAHFDGEVTLESCIHAKGCCILGFLL